MKDSALFREIVSLPPEALRQVVDFVAFLKTRYPEEQKKNKKTVFCMEKESFIGMWQDRKDMQDSSEWVRSMRRKEWGDS